MGQAQGQVLAFTKEAKGDARAYAWQILGDSTGLATQRQNFASGTVLEVAHPGPKESPLEAANSWKALWNLGSSWTREVALAGMVFLLVYDTAHSSAHSVVPNLFKMRNEPLIRVTEIALAAKKLF